MRRFFRSIYVGLIFVVALPVSAGALSPDQTNIFDSGIYYYDTQTSGSTSEACSVSGVGGGGLDQFLRALITKEGTGGNPTAHTAGSSAYGKYQYFDSTWRSQAQSYYPPALQYQHASDAPEAVQDAVAYLEFTVVSIHESGSVFRMAVNHYEPAALNSLSLLNSVPEGNSLTPRQYGNDVVNDFNGNSGSNIPLLYSQAPDFNTYAAKAGQPADLWAQTLDSDNQLPPTSPPLGTSTTPGGGSPCSGIANYSFVFYDQGDPRWAGHPIYTANDGGSDTIGSAGCGPTSAAMVVATLADSSVTPIQTGDYMTQLGSGVGYTSGGATPSGLIQAVEHWGLNAKSIGTDFNAAITSLKQGGLIIAGGAGASPFSKDGHVVVLRGLDGNGNFLIGNPAPSLQQSQDAGFSAAQLQSAGIQYMIEVTK